MTQQEIATLGGGCFWCLEAVYDEMLGVLSVESGYMGGHVANPSYRAVCTGTTGHVEVVRVTFDPAISTYREILEVFFATHDPTTRDRQGNDSGPQYRSVIFYHSEEQRAIAEALIRELDSERIWSMSRRTTTRSTSATIRRRRTALISLRPRWRSSARSSPPSCGV
jgi:peptide-methionine (S)-S-oxide reductase